MGAAPLPPHRRFAHYPCRAVLVRRVDTNAWLARQSNRLAPRAAVAGRFPNSPV